MSLNGIILSEPERTDMPYVVEFNGNKYHPYHYRNNFLSNHPLNNRGNIKPIPEPDHIPLSLLDKGAATTSHQHYHSRIYSSSNNV